MHNRESYSIGIFDSGVGGLTIKRQLMRHLPQESMIYFGDTARIPYGNKSCETIVRYSIENAFFLMEQNIKLLVVACNTASAFAIPKLRQIFNIPVIGVIEPGAEKAAQVTKNQRIAIIGTRGTIQSGAYQQELKRLLPQATILAYPCPLFVPLVEEGFLHHPAAELIIKEYLAPIKSQQVDTLLLGCTHYPFLETLIQQEMGPTVHLVDPAAACAEQVALLLQKQGMNAKSLAPPTYHYYVSDDPHKFQELSERLFGYSIHPQKAPSLLQA